MRIASINKTLKRDRARLTPLITETLKDPDKIWLGVARKRDPPDQGEEPVIDRRYIRVDPKTGLIVVFEIGDNGWEVVTTYAPADKKGRTKLSLLDRRRGGKLIYKRGRK